jgi:holo-ACP synthase
LNKDLGRLLAARERRWKLRLELASKSRGCLVTATLRTPAKYRVSKDSFLLMKQVCGALCDTLALRGVDIDKKRWINGEDGPALLLSLQAEPEAVKRLCVDIEEKMLHGKILDLDVMGADGTVFGREQLGFPPRKCFVCDNPAAVCVSRRLHSPRELAEALEEITGLSL